MVKSDDQPRVDRDDDERWFGGRRWTGYAAIGFIVVIAVCVGILVLLRHGSSATAGQATVASTGAPLVVASSAPVSTAASAAPPATSPAQVAPAKTTASAAPVVPTAAPTGTVWQLVAGQAIPSQPGVGPAHVDGYTATGYAHTPLGALYGAANDVYRVPIAVSAEADWQTPLAAMVAPGPGEKVLASLREPMDPEPIGADGMGMSQLAAFKYVSYTDTDAVVQLVLKDKNGGLHVSTVPMKWLNADWRLVMTPDGTIGGADTVVNSLDGFQTWQGVS
jgi:hypothetical protein